MSSASTGEVVRASVSWQTASGCLLCELERSSVAFRGLCAKPALAELVSPNAGGIRPISASPGTGPFVSTAGIDLLIESLNVDDAHLVSGLLPSRFEPTVELQPRMPCSNVGAARFVFVRTSSLWFRLEMLKPRLLGIFLLAAAPIFTGAEFALARDARE